MKLKGMSLGPLGTNCYIVSHNDDAIIIDPGGEPEMVVSYLKEKEFTPQAILLTHAHFDHIGGVEELRNRYNIAVYLHEKEATWLSNPALNGSSLFMGKEIIAENPDYYLNPGTLNIESITLQMIHTPGHSPGSMSFIFHDPYFVIGGDVLFNRGIGRTDLPGGDIKVLENSIRNGLYTIPDYYMIYPGHGPKTTIGEEKQHNPFFPG